MTRCYQKTWRAGKIKKFRSDHNTISKLWVKSRDNDFEEVDLTDIDLETSH